MSEQEWKIVERPGYLGKRKDFQEAIWNEKYGQGNWRLGWELADQQMMDYEDIFWKVYVAGYTKYFQENTIDARWLTEEFAYGYDKDLISKKEAFDPYALYEKLGFANQFHHVALNIALEWFLGEKFQGKEPIQIREGKPGTDDSTWPLGWRFSPGRIPAVRQDLIPTNNIQGWWGKGSIEEQYQISKVLLIATS